MATGYLQGGDVHALASLQSRGPSHELRRARRPRPSHIPRKLRRLERIHGDQRRLRYRVQRLLHDAATKPAHAWLQPIQRRRWFLFRRAQSRWLRDGDASPHHLLHARCKCLSKSVLGCRLVRGGHFTLLDHFFGRTSGGNLSIGLRELTATFADYSYAIPNGATQFAFRLTADNFIAADEAVAFDNVRILGDAHAAVLAVAEPDTLWLMGLGLLGALRRCRRIDPGSSHR